MRHNWLSRAPSTRKRSTIGTLIKAYKKVNKPRIDLLLAGFRNLRSLEVAVTTAALGIKPDGKRHGHQRRLSKEALKSAATRLRRVTKTIAACRSFYQLIHLVERATRTVSGFGELAKYDTALRIGAYMRLYPNKVYLHAGTRSGAKLFGLTSDRDSLKVHELPATLRQLRAHEIEDFLCIYKDEIAKACR